MTEEAKNTAGLFIRWDMATRTGEGLVLAFNRTKAYQISELSKSDLFGPQAFGTYKWWWGRLKMDRDMMDYIDEPETVIETIKEFEVNSPSELLNLKSAGVNSRVMLGLMEE